MLFDSYENRWYLLDYPYIATFNEGETNDLLTALNYGVMDIGEDGLRYWRWSEGNDVCYETYGLPVFGDYFTTSCAAPIFVEAETVSVGDNLSVRLSWVDTCDAHAWEIKCVEKLYGVIDTIIITDTNSYLIENLTITEDQQVAVYEFKVRTLCDEIYHSKWSDSKLVSFTWDIEENEADNLEIYPNPANDVINVKGVDVNSIHIYNAQGQILTRKDCELGSDASIDISLLESGLYLMQVYSGSNVINRTFVKK